MFSSVEKQGSSHETDEQQLVTFSNWVRVHSHSFLLFILLARVIFSGFVLFCFVVSNSRMTFGSLPSESL